MSKKSFKTMIWTTANSALITISGASATLEIMCLRKDGKDCFRLTGLAGNGEVETEDGTEISLPVPEE